MLEALLNAREELVDFHYIARGKITPQYPHTQSTYEVWKQGSNIRCDWKLEPAGLITSVITSPDSSYVRIGNSEVLRVSESVARNYMGEFDIKALGLALYQELGNGYTVSEIVRSLQRQKGVMRTKQIKDGLIEIEYGPLPEGEVRVFRIDPSKDFAVLECIEMIPGAEAKMLQKASIEWDSFFGRWVPTRLELLRSGVIDRSFSVEWVSINQPIEWAIFDPQKAFESSRFFVTESNGKFVGETIHPVAPKRELFGRATTIAIGVAFVIGYFLLRKFKRTGS